MHVRLNDKTLIDHHINVIDETTETVAIAMISMCITITIKQTVTITTTTTTIKQTPMTTTRVDGKETT